MKVLSAAYPFANVTKNTSGGSEQIVYLLDSFFSNNGIDSFVIAAEYSKIKGRLIKLNPPSGLINEEVKIKVYNEYRQILHNTVDNIKPDLIHFHGVDYANYLPEIDTPALITLHLPSEYYTWNNNISNRKNLHFNAVSYSQSLTFTEINISEIIPNGIDVKSFIYNNTKEDFFLCLGRICPEKGYHLLLNELKGSELHLIIAGELFKYPYHIEYYKNQIEPLLNNNLYWIGPADYSRKKGLLSRAKCLIIPSTVNETSSLSAMEALASGTPVIAMNKGALPEIINNGLTGIIINDISEIHDALKEIIKIEPEDCRKEAEKRFDFKKMARSYLNLYGRILSE